MDKERKGCLLFIVLYYGLIIIGLITVVRDSIIFFRSINLNVPSHVQKYLNMENESSYDYDRGFIAGFNSAILHVNEWYSNSNSNSYSQSNTNSNTNSSRISSSTSTPLPSWKIVYYNKVSKLYHAISTCVGINTAFTQYSDTVAAVTLLGYTPCPRCIK